MANIGLLLDAKAKLNILPDEHRANYKYLAPARFLQSAMLVLLVLFSLFTFSNTRTLDLPRRERLRRRAFLVEASPTIYYIFPVPVNVGAKMGVLILKLQQHRMSGSLDMRATCTSWKLSLIHI